MIGRLLLWLQTHPREMYLAFTGLAVLIIIGTCIVGLYGGSGIFVHAAAGAAPTPTPTPCPPRQLGCHPVGFPKWCWPLRNRGASLYGVRESLA